MAMSDCRISRSASSMSTLPTAMPMLAPIFATWPSPRSTGTSNCAWIRSTTRLMPCASSGPPSRTANSSPPRRAAVSAGRRQPRSRVAIVRSTASPTSWPYSSLTGLKPSRSRYSTAGQACVRAATSTAWRARSRNSVRLGSPVSASCRVWWRSCSLRSVTWRSVSSSRPRSSEVATCRPKVSSSARSLRPNVVHVTEPAGDEQQPVHPVLGAQRGDHRVLVAARGGVGVQRGPALAADRGWPGRRRRWPGGAAGAAPRGRPASAMTTGSAPSWLRLTVSPPLPELLTSTSSARPARNAVRAEVRKSPSAASASSPCSSEVTSCSSLRFSCCSRARV